MDSIEQLNKDFLEIAKKKDIQDFCEKQFKEILSLQKDLINLKEENNHLKKLITENQSFIIEPAHKITNEELICLQQIEKLKSISDTNDLTLEESRKLDTFVKLLKIIRSKESFNNSLGNVNTEDLMKLVEDNVQSK